MKKPVRGEGGSSSTSKNHRRNLGINDYNNRSLPQYLIMSRHDTTFKSDSESGSSIYDIDKSDNRISLHRRHLRETGVIAPLPRAKYNNNKTNKRVISKDSADDVQRKHNTFIVRTLQTAGGGVAAFSMATLFDRPRHKRQFNYQHAPLSASTTSFPVAQPELLTKKPVSSFFQSPDTTATTFTTSSAAIGKIIFTKTKTPETHHNRGGMMMLSGKSFTEEGYRTKRVTRNSNVSQQPTVLTILGLFELTQNKTSRANGISEKLAAEMALEDINAKGILKGCRLIMHTNDTQASFS